MFDTLGIEADLHCEDVFGNCFEPESLDLVYSCGVIKHFNDPREIVREHVTLLKPGGKAPHLVLNMTRRKGLSG